MRPERAGSRRVSLYSVNVHAADHITELNDPLRLTRRNHWKDNSKAAWFSDHSSEGKLQEVEEA